MVVVEFHLFDGSTHALAIVAPLHILFVVSEECGPILPLMEYLVPSFYQQNAPHMAHHDMILISHGFHFLIHIF
jgi:hypothetical protein